jgi:hypothetical protein
MNYKKLLINGVGLLVLATGSLLPILQRTAAAAPASGEWISQTQISYNGQVFTDTQLDDTWEFFANADSSGSACNDKIGKFDGGETKPSGGTIEKNPTGALFFVGTKDPATGACHYDSGTHIALNDVAAAHADFVWQDATTISGVTGGSYVQNSSDRLFYEQGGDQCKDTLQIVSPGSASAPGSAKLIIRTGGDSISFGDHNLWVNQYVTNDNTKQVDGCTVYDPITVAISDFNDAVSKAGGSSGVGLSGTGSGGTGNTKTCENTGGPLSWIICAAIRTINGAETAVESEVQSLLQTRPLVFGTSASCTGTDAACSNQKLGATIYTVWSNFRVYGDIVLVIALLVIVFGESIGGGLIDAYTVKKVLPRILIAAILINLSIYIVALLEDIVNILGNGLSSLIEAPFTSLAGQACTVPDPNATTQIAANNTCDIMSVVKISGGTSLALGAGIAVIMGGVWIAGFAAFMLAVVLPLLIAVIGVLVTLSIRQGLLVILLLLAPVAFALYCLPNTEKYFKKWWDLLIKTLLVYPVVMVVFALAYISGVVMSHLIPSSILSQAMTILAVVAPMFLIPFAFKLSGGVISNVQGMVSNLANKANKPLRKRGMQSAASRLQRAQNNQLYDKSTRRGRFGNTIATWATAPGSNLAYAGRNTPFLRKRGQKVASQIEHARVEQTGKLFEEVNKITGANDKALRALSGMHYGFREPVREELKKAGLYMREPKSISDMQTMGRILEQYGEGTEKIGGGVISANAGRLATLYQDPEMGKASIAGAGIMGLAAHGFADSRDLTNAANYLAGGTFTSEAGYRTDDEGNYVLDREGNRIREDTGNFSGGHGDETGFALGIIGQAQQLGARSRPEAKNGYGVMYGGNGRFVDGMSEEGGRMGAVLDTFGPHDLASAKGGAIRAVRPEIKKRLRGERGENIRTAMRDQLFSWAGPYSQASQDVKAEALAIIHSEGLDTDFANTLRVMDPRVRTGFDGPAEPPSGGAPGGA